MYHPDLAGHGLAATKPGVAVGETVLERHLRKCTARPVIARGAPDAARRRQAQPLKTAVFSLRSG
jgi:hypothetical protein